MEFPTLLTHRHGRGSLPIVIGITGHRDIRETDRSALRGLIKGVLEDFSTTYPYTPLVFLTSLAEGADRLGAEVAYEMGIEVIVPLPFEPEEYKKDFASEGLVKDFDAMLARANRWFVVPNAEGVTSENVSERYYRNAQYGQVGAYISRYSQILIALWDGQHLELQGGTSSVVRMKLEGYSELEGAEQNPLDPPESGPVYHIVTPRECRRRTPNSEEALSGRIR
jgi:hypothetical protein